MNKSFIVCFLFATIITACSKSAGSQQNGNVSPVATINNVSQQREPANSELQFTVSLDKVSTSDITIHYSTVEGTAKENTDFTAASGTITIPANQKQATISVEIIGDSLRKTNQIFYVQLDHPQNCTLGSTGKGTATIVNENGLYFPVDTSGYTTPDSYPGYTLAWSDEFEGNAINTNNWSFETGGNGWGNNELENYTNTTQNAFVSQGNLIIEARAQNSASNTYTSARMITKSRQQFQFGRVDIRAKLPTGKGIWPALWMLGSNIDAVGWPTCGEIDLMELLGQEPNKVYGTLHWGSSAATHQSFGTNYVLNSGSFDKQFHVFSMIWDQDSIKLLVDDVQYFADNKQNIGPDYPFNNTFFFIFNIAVGGNWPGNPDNTTVFPQRMIVDYIRVFQK